MKKNNELTILWDFDGTLFDTYPVYTKIMKQVINDELISEEAVYEQLKVSFSHARSYYKLTEKQVKENFELEANLSPGDVKPFEFVEDILKFAKRNVIMTHKYRKEVLAILEYYGWEHYFSEIVAGDDGFPRKPDKASYEYLHQKYQIDLVIGDREIDIRPAKDLGIASCLFQNKESKVADYSLDNYKGFWDNISF